MPPSITRFWPVTNLDKSLQRKHTTSAMSSGVPIRARGVLASMCGTAQSIASSGLVRPVAIMPGETAFTRMVGAYSSAALAVLLRAGLTEQEFEILYAPFDLAIPRALVVGLPE